MHLVCELFVCGRGFLCPVTGCIIPDFLRKGKSFFERDFTIGLKHGKVSTLKYNCLSYVEMAIGELYEYDQNSKADLQVY